MCACMLHDNFLIGNNCLYGPGILDNVSPAEHTAFVETKPLESLR